MSFKIWVTKIVLKINASKLFRKLPTKLPQKLGLGLCVKGWLAFISLLALVAWHVKIIIDWKSEQCYQNFFHLIKLPKKVINSILLARVSGHLWVLKANCITQDTMVLRVSASCIWCTGLGVQWFEPHHRQSFVEYSVTVCISWKWLLHTDIHAISIDNLALSS